MENLSYIVYLRSWRPAKRFCQGFAGSPSHRYCGPLAFIFTIRDRQLFNSLLNSSTLWHPLTTSRSAPVSMPFLFNNGNFSSGSFLDCRSVKFIGALLTYFTGQGLILRNRMFDSFSLIIWWIILFDFIQNEIIIPDMRQIQLWRQNHFLFRFQKLFLLRFCLLCLS